MLARRIATATIQMMESDTAAIVAKDTMECKDPELNPCVGLCINEPGSVSCTRPLGKHGDGRKQGSGCTSRGPTVSSKEKDMVPLEPVLGNIFKFAY